MKTENGLKLYISKWIFSPDNRNPCRLEEEILNAWTDMDPVKTEAGNLKGLSLYFQVNPLIKYAQFYKNTL